MALENFISRHNGSRKNEVSQMLMKLGETSEKGSDYKMEDLLYETFPDKILLDKPLNLSDGISEFEYSKQIKEIASQNQLYKTYIGQGYYGTITPAVIQRNILENPAWYTSYTPYQAEISQGRLEALLNFQTLIIDLTGMEIANASLLDEATAAAEAMAMMFNARSRAMVKNEAIVLFVDENIFPQTLSVLRIRAKSLNIEIIVDSFTDFEFYDKVFGAIVQYPGANGNIDDYSDFVKAAHQNNSLVTVMADILSLVLLTPPGEWGADIVAGSTQRFGIPMGYGGPHAAYFATSKKYKRTIPGRIIGVSQDANGNKALRMALQTREQHIKREKATSNICTAQALLAIMAGMYGVYHGAEGLKRIAKHIHGLTNHLAKELIALGCTQENENYFDTIRITLPKKISTEDIQELALENEINFYYVDDETICISLDETTLVDNISDIIELFAEAFDKDEPDNKIRNAITINKKFIRKSDFLAQDVFNLYRSETEMMRYIKKLERKDFSLTHSMISLGSCTMKLNSATSMLPLSWVEFSQLHPFVPIDQAQGYQQIFNDLETDLKEITGFDAISLQPNSGAAGEYTGLMVINAYLESINQGHRNIVLIPASAHGTNPASAVMAGMKVIVVDCDEKGNVDIEILKSKAEEYKDNLAAFMVTYPSTHGVFEVGIIEMCEIIHQNGGQVYMDGANMNAQVGLTNPAKIGADVCHLNLHKTFAIPHGGGGPGVGPIGVAAHLSKFLPSHSVISMGGDSGIDAVAAAPWGSANVLLISHAYIKMSGGNGLTEITKMAILNANYIATSLKDYYKILYTGGKGRVAHEMILECRNFKAEANISESDIAKRLMDYGFHAPTLSFPVHGTLMIEPTESESKRELDRFIEALISIYNEIRDIITEKADKNDNLLKNAPHTAEKLILDDWQHPYSRHEAGYPLKWVADNKFFPAVGRIDDAFGDRNLCCTI